MSSFLIEQGTHPKEIQAQLGDSWIKGTHDTYRGSVPALGARLDEALWRALAGRGRKIVGIEIPVTDSGLDDGRIGSSNFSSFINSGVFPGDIHLTIASPDSPRSSLRQAMSQDIDDLIGFGLADLEAVPVGSQLRARGMKRCERLATLSRSFHEVLHSLPSEFHLKGALFLLRAKKMYGYTGRKMAG